MNPNEQNQPDKKPPQGQPSYDPKKEAAQPGKTPNEGENKEGGSEWKSPASR
jgi:hypothetical protein